MLDVRAHGSTVLIAYLIFAAIDRTKLHFFIKTLRVGTLRFMETLPYHTTGGGGIGSASEPDCAS